MFSVLSRASILVLLCHWESPLEPVNRSLRCRLASARCFSLPPGALLKGFHIHRQLNFVPSNLILFLRVNGPFAFRMMNGTIRASAIFFPWESDGFRVDQGRSTEPNPKRAQGQDGTSLLLSSVRPATNRTCLYYRFRWGVLFEPG